VYLAYYLHWSLDAILDLPHGVRAEVIERVGSINAQRGGQEPPTGIAPFEQLQ
jgi:hypothetical protein